LDKEIHKKYENELSPFNGMVLNCTAKEKDFISLDILRELINLIIEFLSEYSIIDEVYKCFDWQEHDGYLTVKKIVPLCYLTYLVKDNDTLYSERSEDFLVNIGLFDKQSRWYLRIYIIDEFDLYEGEEKGGRLDITISKEYVDLLKDRLTKLGNLKVEVNKPKDYFEQIFV
jgi:hypothetical protein